MESQNFHNRMVNDLRKNIQEPTPACKAGQKQIDKLHVNFISQRILEQSFEEEYRKFLIENGTEVDERYFLKE